MVSDFTVSLSVSFSVALSAPPFLFASFREIRSRVHPSMLSVALPPSSSVFITITLSLSCNSVWPDGAIMRDDNVRLPVEETKKRGQLRMGDDVSVNVSEVKLIVIPVMQKTAEGDAGSDTALTDFSMVS